MPPNSVPHWRTTVTVKLQRQVEKSKYLYKPLSNQQMRSVRWLYLFGFLESITPVKFYICKYFSACGSLFVSCSPLYVTYWHQGLGITEAFMLSMSA